MIKKLDLKFLDGVWWGGLLVLEKIGRELSVFKTFNISYHTPPFIMKKYLPWLLFSLQLIWSCSLSEQRGHPNILLILTDDQGWTTIGAYGGELVSTPHLDQLAAEGVRFTNAYVTSQCTPTRASLLTGQYTARNGMWHVIGWYGYPWAYMRELPFRENLSRDAFTIAKGLRAAGYRTGIVGKWHLTTNEDGNYRGLNPTAADYYGFDYAPPVLDEEEFAAGRDRGVATLTKQAISFMERNKDQPWFCLLSHHMIHGKVVAPDSLVNKYRLQGYGEEGFNRAVYLAGLELIDWSVGTLLDYLAASGESGETMVVFISDNGGIDERLAFRSVTYDHPDSLQLPVDIREYDNAPLRAGKGSVYEGGVRVPMIIKWPGKAKAGVEVNTPVHVIDLAPTFFEMADTEVSSTLDGSSLLPLLTGRRTTELAERPIFQFYPFYDLLWGLTPCASIRKGDYKLIEFYGDHVDAQNRYRIGSRIELYNLKTDLEETHNLADSLPHITRALKRELDAWRDDMGHETPNPNPHFDPSRAFESTRDKSNRRME